MTNPPSPPHFIKHPHFNLMLPSDNLLADVLGAQITERVVCHEWPLSCVEKIIFEGGIEKYCKTTLPPSIEIAVYETLSSPLLVPHRVVSHTDSSSTLLLDSFPGDKLSRSALESQGLPSFITSLRSRLSTLKGTGPVFVDLSTSQHVRQNMNSMLERMYRLFGPGTPSPLDSSLLSLAKKCASDQAVCDAFLEDITYTNGDLSADNILVRGDEMRIIDWQFPRLVGIRVELVNLLTSLGIEPTSMLSPEIVISGLLCKIRWFAECADLWITGGDYLATIEDILKKIGQVNATR